MDYGDEAVTTVANDLSQPVRSAVSLCDNIQDGRCVASSVFCLRPLRAVLCVPCPITTLLLLEHPRRKKPYGPLSCLLPQQLKPASLPSAAFGKRWRRAKSVSQSLLTEISIVSTNLQLPTRHYTGFTLLISLFRRYIYGSFPSYIMRLSSVNYC